jgi:CO/xanthine dehydrogenase FAD-binding subunit
VLSLLLYGDVLTNVKIALGGVSPTSIRAKKAEGILKGKRLNDDLLERASLTVLDESRPIDDIRSSVDYRRRIVKVLVGRAIKQAVEQVKADNIAIYFTRRP